MNFIITNDKTRSYMKPKRKYKWLGGEPLQAHGRGDMEISGGDIFVDLSMIRNRDLQYFDQRWLEEDQ